MAPLLPVAQTIFCTFINKQLCSLLIRLFWINMKVVFSMRSCFVINRKQILWHWIETSDFRVVKMDKFQLKSVNNTHRWGKQFTGNNFLLLSDSSLSRFQTIMVASIVEMSNAYKQWKEYYKVHWFSRLKTVGGYLK